MVVVVVVTGGVMGEVTDALGLRLAEGPVDVGPGLGLERD